MQKNKLYKRNDTVIRILEIKEDKALVIDCIKKTMPKWIKISELSSFVDYEEQEQMVILQDIDSLDANSKKVMYERYTIIVGVLPFVGNENMRSKVIDNISLEFNVSKQTIRKYLCTYLVYRDIKALTPNKKEEEKELSQDEKNIRWALNKFFYNKNKNTLKTAYTLMLKEKYCNGEGKLLPNYPSFYQFRYFYRKHKNLQTYYISREGLKNYQRNHRPLVGDGVQQFAPNVGTGMLDATVLDLYLVNESEQIIGRPIMTACIDAYSGLCCGYSLTWEGGVYSLRNLMINVVADKVEHCRKFGIEIKQEDWNCSNKLSGRLITDMGSEYKSENFEQLAELGISITNLPSYRPELKGVVEKFFDVVQNYFKPHLKGKGVIEPDYQERGSHDYRKDACLTLQEFEKIIIHCIIFYNSKRIVEDFPYTEEMLKNNIKPYANKIWEWGCTLEGCNLIDVSKEQLILTLLPRIIGKFTRFGLKVNKIRYHNSNYIEKYLQGKEVTIAYNPENVSFVWVIDKGEYIKFELIQSRFKGKDLEETISMQEEQKKFVKDEKENRLQAEIELIGHIQAIAGTKRSTGNKTTKNIRQNRKKEQTKQHKDFMEGVQTNG